jgi:hypothetical protein
VSSSILVKIPEPVKILHDPSVITVEGLVFRSREKVFHVIELLGHSCDMIAQSVNVTLPVCDIRFGVLLVGVGHDQAFQLPFLYRSQ